jgi:hypothetical protein
MTTRRFPPPWTIDEHNEACFIVRDKNGQALAYFYFEEEPGAPIGGQAAQDRGPCFDPFRRSSPSSHFCRHHLSSTPTAAA